MAEREAVRAEMALVKDALVNTKPVSGGRDPTLWLPDELMEMIFLKVLWDGVCQRWGRIVRESTLVKRRMQEEKWAAFGAGIIKPRVLTGQWAAVRALAVGLDGHMFSGSDDTTIRVWSGVDDAHLHTLEGLSTLSQ